MTSLKTPLALLCTFALSVQAAAAPCGYAALQINPLSAARTDIYVGQGSRIEVSFANEATTPTVETFPESNLKIAPSQITQHAKLTVAFGCGTRCT